MADFTSPSDLLPSEWFIPVPVASQAAFPPYNIHLQYPYGLLPVTPWGTPLAQGVPQDPLLGFPDLSSLQLAAIWSASIPPPPPTFPPPNLYRIPQDVYDHGRSQWDFTKAESISFGVNGYRGINMGHALEENFTGLDYRDELVFRGASSAISCRFLVRLS